MSEPNDSSDDCTIHTHPVPADELHAYSVDRDPHLEQDIASYVEGQARDEAIQHVEKIKTEHVLGREYEIWDVTTDKDRWWVITNLTNLYSQKHFPSLDYTLSFHIGLMARLSERSARENYDSPDAFDEVTRRQDQAIRKLEQAKEAEEFQAVAMQLRESLISLVEAMRRRLDIEVTGDSPKAADFIGWSDALMDKLCSGPSNREVRQFLKKSAKQTWQLVSYLTHDRDANEAACSIAAHSCNTIFGHFAQMLVRERTDNLDQCPDCLSRQIRNHFDRTIPPDGDYYSSCAACGWSNYPEHE